jgi:hypothetical protein
MGLKLFHIAVFLSFAASADCSQVAGHVLPDR